MVDRAVSQGIPLLSEAALDQGSELRDKALATLANIRVGHPQRPSANS